MFRFSLIFCFLILGITAKPWNKLTEEAVQETVVFIDDEGKMSRGVEVEPPEDMDKLHYEIDPKMMIWKSMTNSGPNKEPLKAEEDLDELYHPSMADLLQIKIQNLDLLSAAPIQEEPLQADADMQHSQEAEHDKDDIDHPVFSEVAFEEPEQDWDDVYHKAREQLDPYLAPLVAQDRTDTDVRGVLYELENDEDDLYHYDEQHPFVQVEPLRLQIEGDSMVRLHLQPEDDMDDLYHKDPLKIILYQDEAKAAAPVDFPSQRKYSEPEEDLDDLYHK